MISSAANPKVRFVCSLREKSKLRYEKGLFVAEGSRLVSEIPENLIDSIYLSESYLTDSGSYWEGKDYEAVSDAVMTKMSDTVSPQGVLALVKMPKINVRDILRNNSPLILILQDIRDPGNLGTIFRSAEAAGVSGLILSSQCVDPFSPKAVRSTMGSLYRVPFVIAKDLSDSICALKSGGISVVGADCQGTEYTAYDFKKATAIVIGNEANGIYPEILKLTDEVVTIPMTGQIESLNAAVAASVLSFEASRQRR